MGVFQKETFGPAMKIVGRLKEYAEGKGISLLSLAIQWTISQQGVTCALVGANNADQLNENSKALDIELTPSDLQDIADILGR